MSDYGLRFVAGARSRSACSRVVGTCYGCRVHLYRGSTYDKSKVLPNKDKFSSIFGSRCFTASNSM